MDPNQTFEFVSLIQEEPCLWRKQDKLFMNREMRKKCFEAIGEKMNMTGDECKKKLKLLKDKMRDICNKLPKTSSGQPAFEIGEQTIKWPFYQAMLFMKDQFVGRGVNSSFQDSVSQPSSSQNSLADVTDDEETGSPSANVQESQKRTQNKMNAGAKPVVSKKARQTEQLLDIEREKLQSMKNMLEGERENNKPVDEWGPFVHHLVHDLRKVKHPQLVMSLKHKINNIVGECVLQQFSLDEQLQQQLQQVHVILQLQEDQQQSEQQQQQQRPPHESRQ